MTTALLTHEDCLGHVTPGRHPERGARLQAIAQALAAPGFAALRREAAPLATDADLGLAHPPDHIAAIRAAAPASGIAALDPDTFMSPGSFAAARRAAGAGIRAVDLVLGGEVANAFSACRPPGHHAETRRPMGFCLFGNAVIAARHALDRHGLSRVAIVDFDVHHGNGTQDLVRDDARILYVSSHQMPLYPGTGAADERGAHGQVVNIPLPPGSDGSLMRERYEAVAFPALAAHRPELIVVSAGFDAHRADPLANLAWDEADYAWLTGRLCDLAAELCAGRLVATLEGGYDLDALAASAAAHVLVLMERGA